MSRKEIMRQSVHAIFGTVLIAVLVLYGGKPALFTAALALGFGMIFSALIKKGVEVPLFTPLVNAFGRKQEKVPGFGAMMFLSGMIITIMLFRAEIAAGALLVAVYGDAASTMVGKRFGRTKTIGDYTLEGTVSGIIVAFLALTIFRFPPIAAALAALAGMLVELLPVDDNLTIPVVAGFVLSVLV
jgi:dolichol kinase